MVRVHRRSPARFALLSFGIWASALSCGGGGGGAPGPAQLRGSLSILGATSTVLEQEPNDSVSQANPMGELRAGQTLTIFGTISDDGSDPFDAFLFNAPALVEVTASLFFDPALDFDFRLYDPVGMAYIATFDSADMPEVGAFQVSGPFILELSSVQGSGSYSFRISAVTPESGAGDAGGPFLASLAPGERLALSGHGERRLLVRLPRAAELFARSTGELRAPIELLDATADPRAPLPPIGPSVASEEGVSARFGARSLAALRIDAAGPWEIELEAVGLPPGSLPPAAPAPLALEGRELRRPPARPFGLALPAVPGELLVRPVEGRPWRQHLVETGAVEVDVLPGFARLVRVPLPPGLEPGEALRSTLAAGIALWSSPDFDRWAANHLHQAQQVAPNDPHYGLQWHYPQIHLPAAWGITTGSDDVIVAVLDTGSSNHPDLVGRFIAGYDFISDPANAGDGDGIDPDPTDVGDGNGVQPSSFHGTHVAGTIGAHTDNGIGVAGVTWATRIMPLRVLGILGGTDFDVANAVLYGARLQNNSGTLPPERAHVMNLSLGGPGSSQAIQDVYTAARNAGVTIFAAAGNDNSSVPFFPAAYSGVISVSAVDLQGNKAPYSNFHATVDLAAPGGNAGADLNGDGYVDGVLSTKINDGVAPPQAIFAFEQGTSMAAPHAAGVAALMLAVNPSLTPAQVLAILASTATDLGAPGKDPIFGHGLINAHAAVLAASGDAGGDPLLSLSTDSLNSGSTLTQADVQIVNAGGGDLVVSAPVISAPPNGTWLGAALGPATATNTNASSVRVTVDRAGLGDGDYFGTVTLDSNGGSETILVLMTVGASPSLPDVLIYVLAVDAQTFQTRAQFVLNPATTSLDYVLSSLPAGRYYVAAGSDDDGNGVICDTGDVWCGLYPALNQPIPVTVSAGKILHGLDFPLVADFNSSLGAGGSSGGSRLAFRRLE